ncbi:hypothetical protein [Cupriavidus oxalaticus]|uniref:Uncharacterized protein n=1 Tax=Cupriavidus oxalaticus TaxID=96344 RepID=A0A4P7LRT6_9BURK|nr:hypothetical protein [Cupriavidus oxalaticus]QBY55181.1 hypothetical protein E0W60_29075 [Cupriavidus oxalaticus]
MKFAKGLAVLHIEAGKMKPIAAATHKRVFARIIRQDFARSRKVVTESACGSTEVTEKFLQLLRVTTRAAACVPICRITGNRAVFTCNHRMTTTLIGVPVETTAHETRVRLTPDYPGIL